MADDLSQLSPVDTCVRLLDFSALIDDADPSLFFRNLISLHFPDTTFSQLSLKAHFLLVGDILEFCNT